MTSVVIIHRDDTVVGSVKINTSAFLKELRMLCQNRRCMMDKDIFLNNQADNSPVANVDEAEYTVSECMGEPNSIWVRSAVPLKKPRELVKKAENTIEKVNPNDGYNKPEAVAGTSDSITNLLPDVAKWDSDPSDVKSLHDLDSTALASLFRNANLTNGYLINDNHGPSVTGRPVIRNPPHPDPDQPDKPSITGSVQDGSRIRSSSRDLSLRVP